MRVGRDAQVNTQALSQLNWGDATGAHTQTALGLKLRDMTNAGHKKIVVNLRGVSYIDSSGIGELVPAFTALKQIGGQLKLCGLSTRLRHILLISKNYAFCDVHDDEAARAAPAKLV